ncbi:hypothetical protein B0H17DRAFT_1202795 [Mycena rosella]|uniref:Chromatin elongation factor spt5 n=1 Tax=Mycena rosella TaxID=1033263 RepID=A0AAD7DCY8_MYCRO|nr:hypothetical protein B0H17DRAFT_1202795 [Mycena rosella]
MPRPALALPPQATSQPESVGQMALRVKRLLPRVTADSGVVQPGTWIRVKEGNHLKLGFTVSLTQIVLECDPKPPVPDPRAHPEFDTAHSAASEPALPAWHSRDTVEQRCETVNFAKRFPRGFPNALFPPVHPTMDEAIPFHTAGSLPLLRTVAFTGPAFCLQPGDSVIIRGQTAVIDRVRDVLVEADGPLRAMELVPPVCDIDERDVVRLARLHYDDDSGFKEKTGCWQPLNHLRQHLLWPAPTPRLLDRVRITGEHRVMDEGVGHISHIADDGETIMVERENSESIEIDLARLRREFRLGDAVLVARGKHKSRKGFVTALHKRGLLAIFDFLVEEVAVDFLAFDADTDSSALFAAHLFGGQYTRCSEVPHPVIPLPRGPAPSTSLTRTQDDLAYHAEKDARLAATSKIRAVDFTAIHTMVSKLRQLDQTQVNLIECVGQRYENLEVLVVGTDKLGKKTGTTIDGYSASVFKGKHSIVIGDFDSPERVKRLQKQDLNRRKNLRGDTRSITVTIRENSGARFQVLVEKVVHATWDPLTLSAGSLFAELVAPGYRSERVCPISKTAAARVIDAHTLAGEDTGTWLCTAAVVNKRLDVVIQGAAHFQGTNTMSASDKLRKLEGKQGVVLLTEIWCEADLKKKKFRVYRVGGAQGLPQQVPGHCIKPLRVAADTRPVTEGIHRVVILGADVDDDKSHVGKYAEMQPHTPHSYGDGIVAVRLQGVPPVVRFYHVLRLCRSTNEPISCKEGDFPPTSFH